MSGIVPLNAGYTVSVRRTRLNLIVLLILEIAEGGHRPVFHEGTHPVTRAIEVSHSHAACKAEF